MVCKPSSTVTGIFLQQSANSERTSSPKQSGLVAIASVTTDSCVIASSQAARKVSTGAYVAVKD